MVWYDLRNEKEHDFWYLERYEPQEVRFIYGSSY